MTTRIPIVRLNSLPPVRESSPLSGCIDKALAEAFGDTALPVDEILDVFAKWAATLIGFHAPARELIHDGFLLALENYLHGPMQ
jgi:hypothetical protein